MIDIKNLNFTYQERRQAKIVNNISFKINKGEIVCLLGPSGCGKTSTLRLIAGLETPNSGTISIAGVCVNNKNIFVEPHKRDVGFLFQDFALFPHLTTKENIAWGLSQLDHGEQTIRIEELLKQTSMVKHRDKYPHELSGGEQQRVSLARALAPKPSLLLLDEPFSSLDTNLRYEVREETYQILKKTNTTAIIVTHDPEEAMLISDKIILMTDGEIQQEGTAQELYENPKNKFIASFLGYVNQVTGIVNGDIIETDIGKLPNQKFPNSSELDIIIRPQALSLSKKINNNHEPVKATIESIKFTGTARHIWANVKPTKGAINKMLVIQDHKEDLKIGDKVHFHIDPKKVSFFSE
jgi:iron(III) transport system ATP-binding protein